MGNTKSTDKMGFYNSLQNLISNIINNKKDIIDKFQSVGIGSLEDNDNLVTIATKIKYWSPNTQEIYADEDTKTLFFKTLPNPYKIENAELSYNDKVIYERDNLYDIKYSLLDINYFPSIK